ncbi:O-acetylhomoserine aminocarboxypropyltransferase/cysteine synthase [Microbacterium betulae]|uniref:homocysteine desulfhydrase n=1 Tax=Microbacterium betulae TaxID=2981139 RepID=A0AA97I505_9MICO|nr:O-acetylhomoserine aminocarboxypropyltransferase/cysteine synthase family protein [Microbacterium sp. AB]WOF23161.1 O-acetylhomoserine aminocarboxypropyltransferase/cysteine synthase [Microbacterium sp. AB]
MTWGFETRQIHAGEVVDAQAGARITPVYQTAGYVFDDFEDAVGRFAEKGERLVYSRHANPTNVVAERRIADLEGGAGALLTGSGQAAIFTTIYSLASAGDHILATSSLYEGTKQLFRGNLARQGLVFDFLDAEAPDAEWLARITPRTKAIFTESIPNPKNDIPDVDRLGGIARRAGVPLVVDNTVATPYLFRPIEHGADIVIHSTSKWLGGHGAVIGGVVVDSGRFDWRAQADRYPQLTRSPRPGVPSFAEKFGTGAFLPFAVTLANDYGPTLPATSAFLLLLGIDTLSLRVERHVANAQRIAEWLDAHPAVRSVDYAGLPGNAYHERARRLLPLGAGSVLAFEVRGGREGARTVIDALELVTRMTHIGDVRTLAIHTGSTIHSKLSEEERVSLGIAPGLIRLSVGLETPDDVIADLDQALARI